MIIPGPSQPKNIDSFLFPLVSEMKLLGHQGIQAIDGDSQTNFTLRASIILVQGMLFANYLRFPELICNLH